MKQKIRIIIADDHSLIRKAFISLLKELKNVEVINEAGNGKELLQLLRSETPDIILLNYKMPLMDGREALQLIKTKYPGIGVIMMSSHDYQDTIIDLITKGANGFVSKSGTPENLFDTIQKVHKDGHYFSSKISKMLVNGIVSEKQKDRSDKNSLSDRELCVLKEICNGSNGKAISDRLFISISTVEYHKTNIYKKTNSQNVVDLVKYAFRNGLIQIT
jgi:DNA-binding NarL/FixJ family response regulator